MRLMDFSCNKDRYKRKENNEKKIKYCDEISKLIKAFPKDIAALDKRSVLAKIENEDKKDEEF